VLEKSSTKYKIIILFTDIHLCHKFLVNSQSQIPTNVISPGKQSNPPNSFSPAGWDVVAWLDTGGKGGELGASGVLAFG
jgi:hypothetical protein